MIDFEQACIRALPVVFPNVTVIGCLFHLCKSVYRRVQTDGLQQQYIDQEAFRTNIGMIPAFAFVPLDDIIPAFERLSQHCQDDEQTIFDYFESNYIGTLRRGRRRRPLFPHTLWNIHGRVQDNLPRTNNALEDWHRQFNQCFAGAHPTI